MNSGSDLLGTDARQRPFAAVVSNAFPALILLAPYSSEAQAQASAFEYSKDSRYDASRRLTGTIMPDPDGPGPLHHLAQRYTYDAAGNLIRIEKGELSTWQPETVAPANWTNFNVFSQTDTSYDASHRKLRHRVSSGGTLYQVTQYSYTTNGQLDCTAVRMNPAGFDALPSSACDLSAVGAQGPDRITKNLYDAAGQLLKVQKAFGVTAANGFATPLQQDYVTYTYNRNGKQISVKDANGNLATMTYDGLDRQKRWNFPSPTSAGEVSESDYEEYTYDAGGNRLTYRKRDGRIFGFTYDAVSRVISKTVPDACASGYACTNVAAAATRDIFYSYDLRGLQTAARFDSAGGVDAVTSVYDGFGRETSSTTSIGGVTRTLTYQYDADGNRVRVTHPDGNYFVYDYDGLDRPIAARENGGTAVVTMNWDNQGRRLGEGRGGVVTTYGYDAISRLNSLSDDLGGSVDDVTTTFGYNAASQITSKMSTNATYGFSGYVNASRSYAANGLNQYTNVAGKVFGNDSNGNLTSDGSIAYTYDADNRLVVTSKGTNLTYDPLGRLYQVSKPTTGTTLFLYDGDQLTAEYDSSGAMLRRYVHGTGEDDPLLWYEGPGLADRRSLQANHQGSIVSVADAAGAAIRINQYDEFGIPAGTNVGRFQYTGQAWIPELGMYHYKARIYSPTLGRFLQTDPVGYQDQVNLYAYVGNDPVNMHDSTGGWSKKVHERIFQLAVGDRASRTQIGVMNHTSVRQDLPWGHGNRMEEHYMRNPGESGSDAQLKYRHYVNEQIQLAKNLAAEGKTLDATRAFARAAHAIADSYSPAHNDNGKPAVYDPSWNFVEGAYHGHSPADFVGNEGTDDLDESTQSKIVEQTRAIYESIFEEKNRKKTCKFRGDILVCEQ